MHLASLLAATASAPPAGRVCTSCSQPVSVTGGRSRWGRRRRDVAVSGVLLARSVRWFVCMCVCFGSVAAVARRFNSGRSLVKALDAQRACWFPSWPSLCYSNVVRATCAKMACARGRTADSLVAGEQGESALRRECCLWAEFVAGNEQVGGHTSKHPCTEAAMKSGVAAALGLYTAVCNWLERSLFCSRYVASGVTGEYE